MGGGGGKRPSRGAPGRPKKPAKKKPGSPQGEPRNVFISFTNEDKPLVELLRGQALKQDSTLNFNDWSLRAPFESEGAEHIRNGVRERIQQSSVTLVYVSDHTATSRWVNWEIEESVKLGKKMVAIYQGAIPRKLPRSIKKHRIKVIAWSQKGIASALK